MADWFVASSVPANKASLVSATVRNEFSAVQAGIADKLPTLTGNGSKIIAVNSGATALEAIASVPVAQGGTGATSLTDGGILLGSGTGAITAMSVLADGAIVVGDGTTDPVSLAAFTSSTGTLKHEKGGIEADISAITNGGLVVGTASGTMAVRASVFTDGASGYLKHEIGGLEADISAIVDGDFIVGTGTGTLGLESGATVRTSLGLGAGDSPTFAAMTAKTSPGVASAINLYSTADGGIGFNLTTLGIPSISQLSAAGAVEKPWVLFTRDQGVTLYYNNLQTFGTYPGGVNIGAGGDIVITSGSITSASGAIDFGDENLTTTGTLAAGAVTATGNITAYYSDMRLKNKISSIPDALEAVNSWDAMLFTANDLANSLGGYDTNKIEVGLSAQSVQATHPQLVSLAPLDRDSNGFSKSGKNYLTLDYSHITAVLVSAIQDLSDKLGKMEVKT